MTNEVIGFEPGILRVRDVRAALGAAISATSSIDVLVVGRNGAPFAGTIYLNKKRAGHGEHVALRCPLCFRARLMLYADAGALRCSHCARHRTRRACERTTREWNRLGGREEDALLRAARRALPNIERMNWLARDIVAGDADRASTVIEFSDAALAAVEEQCSTMKI